MNELNLQHLPQADKWFCIVPEQFIYEVDPQTLTMSKCHKILFFAHKEAMSSGISSVNFIFRINDGHANSLEGGEGFEVSNNLAEKLTITFLQQTIFIRRKLISMPKSYQLLDSKESYVRM